MTASTKNEVFNTRERLLSDDFNRSQSFISAALVDAYRYLYETSSTDEGPAETNVVTTTTPLRGIILGGIRVRPEIGTVNLFVTDGAILIVDPDSPFNADDSVGKLIIDPGEPLSGALTLTAGSGSVRVDIVECARVSEVLETDNRDIYNPSTQLFSPAAVPKVRRDRLQYRIRTGTPGGGFAGVGTVSGWLPLAVCVVSAAAATWDDVELYDVRPLVSDYRRSANQVSANNSRISKLWMSSRKDSQAAPTTQPLRGWIETEYKWHRAGGPLQPFGMAASSVDLVVQATRYVEPGFTAAGVFCPVFGYFMFPFGLPRWARYSPAASLQRAPLGTHGLFVVSAKPPSALSQLNPSSAVTMPSAIGIGGSSQEGVLAYVSHTEALATVIADVATINDWIVFTGILMSPSAGANTANPTYTLTDGVAVGNIPLGVTAVRVRIVTVITAPAGVAQQFNANVVNGTGWTHLEQGTHTPPAAGSFQHSFEIDIPIEATNLPVGLATARSFNITYTFSGVTAFASQSCRVVGVKLGA
jgi:hypothetical protein